MHVKEISVAIICSLCSEKVEVILEVAMQRIYLALTMCLIKEKAVKYIIAKHTGT